MKLELSINHELSEELAESAVTNIQQLCLTRILEFRDKFNWPLEQLTAVSQFADELVELATNQDAENLQMLLNDCADRAMAEPDDEAI